MEDNTRVEAVVGVAQLDPEPVREGESDADDERAHRRDGRRGPRRRQQQQVQGEQQRGHEVEA